MIDDGRNQDAENDRNRPAKARREQQGKELSLVADFPNGDNNH